MNSEETMKRYDQLYEKMATSGKIENMRLFGRAGRESMFLLVKNMPERAMELMEKLESINWDNYLTRKEAEKIVEGMKPEAPWSREQWQTAMMNEGFELEREPCFNRCALWVTMSMIMSDSSSTIGRYVEQGKQFAFVHDLAVDKLTDKDRVFDVRKYFGV